MTDDGFLSLMSTEDFSTKGDVKVPQGEVGEKIEKLFHNEKKLVKVTVLGAIGQELAVEAKKALSSQMPMIGRKIYSAKLVIT